MFYKRPSAEQQDAAEKAVGGLPAEAEKITEADIIRGAQQRMKLLDGSLLVCGVPQQARRVLDAAGIGRLVTIR